MLYCRLEVPSAAADETEHDSIVGGLFACTGDALLGYVVVGEERWVVRELTLGAAGVLSVAMCDICCCSRKREVSAMGVLGSLA